MMIIELESQRKMDGIVASPSIMPSSRSSTIVEPVHTNSNLIVIDLNEEIGVSHKD